MPDSSKFILPRSKKVLEKKFSVEKKAEKGVYSAKPDDYQMDFLIEYCHEARDKKAATAENRKKWKWLKKTEKNEL